MLRALSDRLRFRETPPGSRSNSFFRRRKKAGGRVPRLLTDCVEVAQSGNGVATILVTLIIVIVIVIIIVILVTVVTLVVVLDEGERGGGFVRRIDNVLFDARQRVALLGEEAEVARLPLCPAVPPGVHTHLFFDRRRHLCEQHHGEASIARLLDDLCTGVCAQVGRDYWLVVPLKAANSSLLKRENDHGSRSASRTAKRSMPFGALRRAHRSATN